MIIKLYLFIEKWCALALDLKNAPHLVFKTAITNTPRPVGLSMALRAAGRGGGRFGTPYHHQNHYADSRSEDGI